jgi:hypothetical protein
MKFSQEVLSLIQGGYDLHVHSGPDILPRKMDDIEMAERIRNSGMSGYAIKSHFFCTSERAELMNKLYPECDFIGTISLNSYVGGINPAAMEIAAISGIRMVWFPTCDAENEMNYVFNGNKNKKLPYWAQIKLQMQEMGREAPSICILDENGNLKSEVHSVLEIIAQHNIILNTGHLSHDETFMLLKAAREKGIRKIIVTHADFPSTYYTVEEQKELLDYGAMIEHCYTTWATGKVDFDVTANMIREIGPENCIISTDLGQQKAIYPDEGMAEFARRLKEEKDFTNEEIRTMIVHNPRRLLDKE